MLPQRGDVDESSLPAIEGCDGGPGGRAQGPWSCHSSQRFVLMSVAHATNKGQADVRGL